MNYFSSAEFAETNFNVKNSKIWEDDVFFLLS